MSTNISVIKFTAKTALALAVLTYATTLNIETNFVYHLAPYISNDLFLTIFGGAFASVLVVLLSEIHQYLYKKENLENDFYCRLREIYVLLIVLNSAIQRVFSLNDDVFNKQVFEVSLQQLTEKSNLVNQIDYAPFFHSNSALSVFKKYKISLFPMLAAFVHNFSYLDMAIYQDKISGNEAVIKILEKQQQEHNYGQNNEEEKRELEKRGVKLAYSPKTRKALSLLQHDADAIITKIDSCLQSLDESCKGRYGWKHSKEYVQRQGKNLSYDDYEKFMNREV